HPASGPKDPSRRTGGTTPGQAAPPPARDRKGRTSPGDRAPSASTAAHRAGALSSQDEARGQDPQAPTSPPDPTSDPASRWSQAWGPQTRPQNPSPSEPPKSSRQGNHDLNP